MSSGMRETERISPRYKGIDTWDDLDVLSAMWDSQMAAVSAVRPALPQIAVAARAMAARIRDDNARIIYAGAGSSGLLATQDGMELAPTFGWPADRLRYLMAGGSAARLSLEGASEDDADAARREVAAQQIGAHDVIIGVAASGSTPYTVAALEAARANGALTIGIANTQGAALLEASECPICAETAGEVVAGSTRLGAGTAQKVVLGMLSTLVMTRMGHVVDGMMVSMLADNIKLKERAIHIVCEITGCDETTASAALEQTGGAVKEAVLTALGLSPDAATQRLREQDGMLRAVMNEIREEKE